MGNTLGIASEKEACVITDRGTYLAFQKLTGLAVLLEGDPVFLNIYSVLEVNPEKLPQVNAQGGKTFADFLLSAVVQSIIKNYGADKFGEALFHPDADRTEETLLQQK